MVLQVLKKGFESVEVLTLYHFPSSMATDKAGAVSHHDKASEAISTMSILAFMEQEVLYVILSHQRLLSFASCHQIKQDNHAEKGGSGVSIP